MSEANRVETDTVKKSQDEMKDLSEIKLTSKELLSSITLKLPIANSVFDQQDKATNPILAKNNEVSQEPVKSAALPSVVDADMKQPNATAAAASASAALSASELKTKEEVVTKQKKELEEKVKAAEAAALKVKDKLEAEQKKEKDLEKMSIPADVKATAAFAGTAAAGTAAAGTAAVAEALKAAEEFDVKQKKEQEDKLEAAIAAATARRDKKEMELKEKQLIDSKEKEKEKEKEAEKTKETSVTASILAADRFTAQAAVEVEKIKIGADMPDASTLNTKVVETVTKVDVDVDMDAEEAGENEGEGEETTDNDKEYVEIQVDILFLILPFMFHILFICLFQSDPLKFFLFWLQKMLWRMFLKIPCRNKVILPHIFCSLILFTISLLVLFMCISILFSSASEDSSFVHCSTHCFFIISPSYHLIHFISTLSSSSSSSASASTFSSLSTTTTTTTTTLYDLKYSTAKETKETPTTGTWNSWLGSTGLKAAGMMKMFYG